MGPKKLLIEEKTRDNVREWRSCHPFGGKLASVQTGYL